MGPGRPRQEQQGVQTERGSVGRCAAVAAWAGRAALMVCVLGAPWFLGAVEAWVQVWIYGIVLVSLGLAALYLLLSANQQDRWSVPVAIVPLVLAIGLGILQLIPVDQTMLAWVSPKAVANAEQLQPTCITTEHATAENVGLDAPSDHRSASVYRTATRHALAFLILGTSVFFLGAVFFSRSGTHLWLCGLVAANGAAIGFFGLAQNLTWNGQLYWNIVLTQGGGPFGPFINRNNGGGYLLLCLAAAVGMVLWCLGRRFSEWEANAHGEFDSETRGVAQFKDRVIGVIANLNAPTLSWLTITSLLVAAICCTLSRGSVLAMLAAILVTSTVMVVSQRRGLSIVWPVAIMAVGLLLIGWLGMSDSVGERLATLFNDDTYEQGRIPHWQDGLLAAGDFWRFGSGLGTYRFVYAEHQNYLAEVWFYHAENIYLETLVVAGAFGLGLLIVTLALLVVAVRRLMREARYLRTLAFGVTGVFALGGQLAASMFDFGLLLPANFLLFAVLCGALAGSATRLKLRNTPPGKRAFVVRRILIGTLTCGLLLGSLWGARELQFTVGAEKAMRELRLAGDLNSLSARQLTHHIDELTAVGEHRPDDAELHRQIAELLMQRYRAETMEELRQRSTLAADNPLLAQLASPLVIHRQAWLYARSDMPEKLESLRQSPIVEENLAPALRRLIASREACPLLPEVHCGIAQLCALVGPVSEDELHLARTRHLTSSNPDLLYICGLLDYQAGRYNSAYSSWKASLTLSPHYLDSALRIAGGGLVEQEIVERLLPDSPELLVELARLQFPAEGDQPIREQLVIRAEKLLPEAELPDPERLYLEAAILALRESYQDSIDVYKQAVTLRPREVKWRYELARLLQQQGFLDEALEQAQWCAKLDPRKAAYKHLLKDIHAKRTSRGLGQGS